MSKGTKRRRELNSRKKITRVNIIDEGEAVETLFSFSELDKKKSKEVEFDVGSLDEKKSEEVEFEVGSLDEKKSEAIEYKVGSEEFEEMFPIVDIEGISLEDDFMQYQPQTNREKRVKESIIEAKRIEMKNFRIPAMDPSLDDDGETIIYCAGREPAVGKSAEWWNENAPKFMPSKNSRLKDDLQADVVLGVMLIKYLVEKQGYQVKQAWEAVCVDSKVLGHYWNSKNAKHDEYETTGSRQIGKCFDLGNTCKIVKERETSGFVLFGGDACGYSYKDPLANARSIDKPLVEYWDSVGELVLDV